jgi:hypothetical protein
MSIELVTSAIALAGVIISVIVSVLISSRQAKIELDKLRTEIQRAYTDKLLDKRLNTYPVLYKLLSDFAKIIEYGVLSKATIEKLRKNMLNWDSENGILLSGHSGTTYVKFRKVLSELVKMNDKDFQKEYSSSEACWEMLRQANEVEFALKQDIGIYVVEFADIDRKFKTYQEVGQVIRSSGAKK